MSDQGAIQGSGPSAEQGAPDASVGEAGDSKSPVLDELYEALGHAHALGEDLDQQDREALKQIDAAEKRLTAEREESEAAGDTAKTQAIDHELDQMREAFLTIKDRLGDEDEQQDDDGQRGQRDGDGIDADAPGGPQGPGAADRGDG